eukprot:2179952-Pleurochrysis_carterae.AAC.3
MAFVTSEAPRMWKDSDEANNSSALCAAKRFLPAPWLRVPCSACSSPRPPRSKSEWGTATVSHCCAGPALMRACALRYRAREISSSDLGGEMALRTIFTPKTAQHMRDHT